MKLYGISNCDTVKKARNWLNEHGKSYEFHDFKKQGITIELLNKWIDQLGWEALINKQGTTWRKLDPARQASICDAASALALMQSQPSVIKRPILSHAGQLWLGFKPERYQTLP